MTDPYTPSDEAIAAYPGHVATIDPDTTCGVCRATVAHRQGFDTGAAATRAQQYAADREEIIKSVLRVLHPKATRDWTVAFNYAREIASALLASGGPLVDVREVRRQVWDEAVDWVADGTHDTTEWKKRNPYLGEARA